MTTCCNQHADIFLWNDEMRNDAMALCYARKEGGTGDYRYAGLRRKGEASGVWEPGQGCFDYDYECEPPPIESPPPTDEHIKNAPRTKR